MENCKNSAASRGTVMHYILLISNGMEFSGEVLCIAFRKFFRIFLQ